MVYETCPWQFYRTFILGESPPVTPAMRAGTSIHKVISDYYRQPGLFAPHLSAKQQPLFDTFRASRFNLPAVDNETPFLLTRDAGSVRGRIDVVLLRGHGFEVVDFKSGSRRDPVEMERSLQLPLYAIAIAQRFQVQPEQLHHTYFFLRDGAELSWPATSDLFSKMLARIDGMLESIAAEHFQPAVGCACFACRRTPAARI